MYNVKIANGWNNTGGLKYLFELSAGLFLDFSGGEVVYTEWSSFDEQILDGNKEPVPIGLPSDRWSFFRLTRAEYAYLRANFGVHVTIYTLNKDTNAYGNYNAVMMLPNSKDLTWDRDTGQGFDDVYIDFIELVAI